MPKSKPYTLAKEKKKRVRELPNNACQINITNDVCANCKRKLSVQELGDLVCYSCGRCIQGIQFQTFTGDEHRFTGNNSKKEAPRNNYKAEYQVGQIMNCYHQTHFPRKKDLKNWESAIEDIKEYAKYMIEVDMDVKIPKKIMRHIIKNAGHENKCKKWSQIRALIQPHVQECFPPAIDTRTVDWIKSVATKLHNHLVLIRKLRKHDLMWKGAEIKILPKLSYIIRLSLMHRGEWDPEFHEEYFPDLKLSDKKEKYKYITSVIGYEYEHLNKN